MWEMIMTPERATRSPWNKGKLVGQKAPLRVRDVWAIRKRLQLQERVRDLALFNLGIDSKLRGCDLVGLRVRHVRHGDAVASRTLVMQQKTGRPVQFELTAQTREAVAAWIAKAHLSATTFYFPAESMNPITSGQGNMRGSLGGG